MKRTLIYSLSIVWILVQMASCERHHSVRHGFVNEPRDSIVLDLRGFAADSSIRIEQARKCGDNYYFLLRANSFPGQPDYLFAVSVDDLQVRRIPVIVGTGWITSLLKERNSLVVSMGNGRVYRLHPKTGRWTRRPSAKFDGTDRGVTFYKGRDWIVKYRSCFEFGRVVWFIDRRSGAEYAFVNLAGTLYRLGDSFYVIGDTRIYRIDDPAVGFPCDSATRFENVGDIDLLARYFHDAGYFPPTKYFVPPIIQFDDRNLSGKHYFEDGTSVWFNPYEIPETIAKTDTSIISAFKASDTLFCLLDTPYGWALTKLDHDRLIPIHSFERDPDIIFWDLDRKNPKEERIILLTQKEDAVYDLYDIGQDGNTILRLIIAKGL